MRGGEVNSRQLKVESGKQRKRRDFTQRDTECAEGTEKRGEDGHDVSCPYGVMVFCYDYA